MYKKLITYTAALTILCSMTYGDAKAAAVSCDIKYSEAVIKDIDAQYAPIDIDMLLPIDECIKKMQAESDQKRAKPVLDALLTAKKDCTAMKTMLITPGQPFPTQDKGRPTWCEDPDLNKVQQALAAYNGGGTSAGSSRPSTGSNASVDTRALGGAAAAAAGATAASAASQSGKKPGFFAKVKSFFTRKK